MKKHFIDNKNIMLTACILLIFFTMFISVKQFVKADEAINYEKSFTSIEIKNGDTLTSIAREYAVSEAEYQDYITEVKMINNLKSDVIHSGCFLLIPTYKVIE